MTEVLFSKLVWIWIIVAIVLFPILLMVTAPYGRHAKVTWGPMVDNRLGWFFMESPALIVFLYFLLRWGNFNNIIVSIAFILWVTHYFHRSILFPLRLKTEGKKMPLVIAVFAIFFNLINATVNGYWLSNFAPGSTLQVLDFLRIGLGILMFITGFVINKYHDRLLIKLRKNHTKDYQVPYGGLFRYVSCPNFFGEIIEWGGFALMVWSLPAFSFLVWTFVNLVPRAIDHHKWYREQFTDYPANRKAIIPYIL